MVHKRKWLALQRCVACVVDSCCNCTFSQPKTCDYTCQCSRSTTTSTRARLEASSAIDTQRHPEPDQQVPRRRDIPGWSPVASWPVHRNSASCQHKRVVVCLTTNAPVYPHKFDMTSAPSLAEAAANGQVAVVGRA